MLRQNDRRINLKLMALHHIPKRSPQQPNILRLAQKRSPMMRHQREKIGAARYSGSAVLHRLNLGFRALNPSYHFGYSCKKSIDLAALEQADKLIIQNALWLLSHINRKSSQQRKFRRADLPRRQRYIWRCLCQYCPRNLLIFQSLSSRQQ